ncbi:MAG: diacylglycerol kinase family protein [bacterium]
MVQIGVVVNPVAGRNRRAVDRAERLGDVLGQHGWVRETHSLDELADVAAECRARRVELLGVCGGDGTLARTLSALVREYGDDVLPRILPLRAGTMNTVARAMGGSAWQPERMLAQVSADWRRGDVLPHTDHQLVAVNGQQYGFMVGVGVPVEFLRVYYGGQRGALGALKTLAPLAASALVGGAAAAQLFEPIPARLLCDGAPAPFTAFTVVYASTIEDIGLGFRPTYRAREQAGRFHVFAGPIPAREFVRCLPAIWRARPTRSRRVFDALASEMVAEFRVPSAYMIDGDLMDPESRLDVVLGPVVRVIRR